MVMFQMDHEMMIHLTQYNKKQLHYHWNDHFIRVTALLGYLDLAGLIPGTTFRWTLTNV